MVKIHLVRYSETETREETVMVGRVPVVGDLIDWSPGGVFEVTLVKLYALQLEDVDSYQGAVARVYVGSVK